jgi:hypothetical protein
MDMTAKSKAVERAGAGCLVLTMTNAVKYFTYLARTKKHPENVTKSTRWLDISRGSGVYGRMWKRENSIENTFGILQACGA